MEVERKKCNRCKMNMTLDKFNKKRDDSYMKICIECNIKGRDNARANKCEHNRKKSTCRECGGGSICEHNRRKSICKECGGSQICQHNRIKSTCKDCSDPIKVIIENWVTQSKKSDKKYNRFDIVNYIDKCFCKNLIEEYPKCYYCQCELQYVLYQGDLATIERLDNDLGHIKSNCVIACRTCNLRKIGSRLVE
jgi:hypothetical protein